MIDELELLKRARPEVDPADDAARSAARASLDAAMAKRPRRWRAGARRPLRAAALVPALGLLVVIAVAAVFLGIHGGTSGSPGSQGELRLVLRGRPTPQARVLSPAVMSRAAELVRLRLQGVVPGARVAAAGGELVVQIRGSTILTANELTALAASPGRLNFYDWEADALTASGQPVAKLLRAGNAAALATSQGTASSGGPGGPGGGSLSLYQAVRLAASQRPWVSATNSRPGPEYFMFGAPRSAACMSAARYYRVLIASGRPCYLAGPQTSLGAPAAVLPPGISGSGSGVRTVVVPQGWVVLRAISPGGFAPQFSWSDPTAQYYVLRDNAAPFGSDLRHAQSATDQSGQPDVEFGFTGAGSRAFQRLTAEVAQRGQLVSGFGQQLNQHFAVALDTQLITVPQIDFRTYPDGVPGKNGADITGAFTRTAARRLAAELRLGALPIELELVSVNGRAAP